MTGGEWEGEWGEREREGQSVLEYVDSLVVLGQNHVLPGGKIVILTYMAPTKVKFCDL